MNNSPDPNDPTPLTVNGSKQPSSASVPSDTSTIQADRVAEPTPAPISLELQLKHSQSAQAYPYLNLSDHEYVVYEVQRHWIGLLPSFLGGFVLLLIPLFLLGNYDLLVRNLHITGVLSQFSVVAWPLIIAIILIGLGLYVAWYIYTRNQLYLTNESVIQEIQLGLFSHQEQTISLANIEDASFDQQGILQYIFNYGSIRLSTPGDETTYRFSFASHPKYSVETLNNAVEAFKNGRPVEDVTGS